jgi:hypothetical protein
MLRRNPRGPVATLADACEADYLVTLKCERCETRRQMHPYNLIRDHERLTTAPLNVSLSGFFCKTCRASVSVTITCTHKHPGVL